MILKSLSLVNYKNFDAINFEFNDTINCLVGQNGVGKTNVLDAIYHLSFGKSYFNPVTSQNIRHTSDFFVIDGAYEKNQREEKIMISAKKGQKKIIKRNGKAYPKISEHIGFLPLVIISPADRDLIIEGSDVRRKFIDGVIAQSDTNYLTTLLKYTKTVTQRNALLKYFAANHTFDATTLAIYNQQMEEYGTIIFETRRAFLAVFIPIFIARYAAISSGHETVEIQYQSQVLTHDIPTLLTQQLAKDRMLQYTSVGVHKDDISLEIDGFPIKKFGSQGQQKSFLIALKLAQFDFLKKKSAVNPLLLLDDIFDKLDETRVEHIIQLVEDQNFGQLFITDTHATRTEKVVQKISQSYQMIQL